MYAYIKESKWLCLSVALVIYPIPHLAYAKLPPSLEIKCLSLSMFLFTKVNGKRVVYSTFMW
jgi:hypothetical protein